ncbi:MAG: hypothetical protein JF597_45050 [Streptomyces sp.]|uniref:hypothetical protein n=1 Tax=Streptomyces sp. TaxID=1931 RepID=UPI0025CEB849|nr:hypothetical protein [Streptomyces sp.]MBW8800492.1 hypothetical protein [Streptomyces sp.]
MTSNTRVVVTGGTPEAPVGAREHRPCGRVPLAEVPTGRRHTPEATDGPTPAVPGSPRLRPVPALLPNDGGS